MKIGCISQCTTELNFRPRRPWPELLPAVAYGDILIAGFARAPASDCWVLLPAEHDLENVLSQIYPEMGFTEVARLWQCLSGARPSPRVQAFDWPSFCSQLRTPLRWADDGPVLCAKMAQAPNDVQLWWQDHGVSPRDLAPLKALKTPQDLASFYCEAERVVRLQPSRSDGVVILEWITDLVLMKISLSDVPARDFQELQAAVRALRYPLAVQTQHAQQKSWIDDFVWPAKTKATVSRQGDRAGLEVKLFATSNEDLTKQISALQRLQEKTQKQWLS